MFDGSNLVTTCPVQLLFILLSFSLTSWYCTMLERISNQSWRTTANWKMGNNSANRIYSTWTWTWIYTLMIETSCIEWTIWINDTFWMTLRIVQIVWVCTGIANRHMITINTAFVVRSTRRWCTRNSLIHSWWNNSWKSPYIKPGLKSEIKQLTFWCTLNEWVAHILIWTTT